jgi:hypothetical protein
VLLVAMALLLDAYMHWFHIGSYRLAGLFFSVGWVGASQGMGCFRPIAVGHE